MTARHSLQRHIVVLGLLIILIGLIAMSDSLHEQSNRAIVWAEGIISTRPVLGMASFVLLAMLSAMLAFFSCAVLAPLAVYAWGHTTTLALLWLGWFLGGLLSFAVGRYFGRSVAGAILGEEKLDNWSGELGERARFVHILLFQACVPSEIPGYVLGTLHYRLSWYAAALAITELPYALATVFLGESFLEGNGQVFIGLGVALVVIGFFVIRLFRRRQRKPDAG